MAAASPSLASTQKKRPGVPDVKRHAAASVPMHAHVDSRSHSTGIATHLATDRVPPPSSSAQTVPSGHTASRHEVECRPASALRGRVQLAASAHDVSSPAPVVGDVAGGILHESDANVTRLQRPPSGDTRCARIPSFRQCLRTRRRSRMARSGPGRRAGRGGNLTMTPPLRLRRYGRGSPCALRCGA
jgi:hypothetical protein